MVAHGAWQLSAGDGDTEGALCVDGWQKLGHFCDRHGQIGVADKPVFAARDQHPSFDSSPFARAAVQQGQLGVWAGWLVFGNKRLDHSGCGVGRPVLDDENFAGVGLLL